MLKFEHQWIRDQRYGEGSVKENLIRVVSRIEGNPGKHGVLGVK